MGRETVLGAAAPTAACCCLQGEAVTVGLGTGREGSPIWRGFSAPQLPVARAAVFSETARPSRQTSRDIGDMSQAGASSLGWPWPHGPVASIRLMLAASPPLPMGRAFPALCSQSRFPPVGKLRHGSIFQAGRDGTAGHGLAGTLGEGRDVAWEENLSLYCVPRSCVLSCPRRCLLTPLLPPLPPTSPPASGTAGRCLGPAGSRRGGQSCP